MSEIFYAAGKEQKNGSTFAYAGEYLKGKMFFKIVAIECRICNIKTVITSKLKKNYKVKQAPNAGIKHDSVKTCSH